MDKAQEREDAAKKELRKRAEKFVDSRLGAVGAARDQLVEALYGDYLDIYFKGASDGADNERDWHQSIGGCPR